jgi:molecular chaperone GrpE
MDKRRGKHIKVNVGDTGADVAADAVDKTEAPPTDQAPATSGTEVPEQVEARPIEELQAEIERLRAELAEEHERYLRAVAELQNYRRRVTREQQEKARYAGQDVLEQILPVMDNLRRILEHEEAAGSDEFARGVRLVIEEFFRVLDQMGVTVIDRAGEQFDPAVHEAVARAETAEAPEGTVVAVDSPGYRLHDRCLRPARVVVATAPNDAQDEDRPA